MHFSINRSSVVLTLFFHIVGECVSSVVRIPLEAIRTQRQTSFASVTFVSWRGWQARLLKDIPFACIQYPLHRWFTSRVPLSVIGGLAGAVAALLTNPLDVWRAHRQTNSSTSALLSWSIKGWMRGSLHRMSWSGVVGGSVYFSVFETAHRVVSKSKFY